MSFVLAYLRALWSDEAAQDTFEYVLIIGGITVAVILAVATPVGGALIDSVVSATCGAISGLPNLSGISC